MELAATLLARSVSAAGGKRMMYERLRGRRLINLGRCVAFVVAQPAKNFFFSSTESRRRRRRELSRDEMG